MPTVNPSPWGPKPQFELASGEPAVGAQLFFYVSGSSTKQNTYTNSTGGVANSNPIVLNSLGMPTNEVWFEEGLLYRVVYAPAGDTDPPSSPIFTIDGLAGINDITVTPDQWVASGITPTFVSGTSFTMPGDQTTEFHIGRRLKSINSGGTIYSRITNSVFGAVTTVTVVNDSGVLDSGLSAVSYGLISSTNTSLPGVTLSGANWTFAGGVNVDGAFVFNEVGANVDARFEGDTDANLLFVDASTDHIGIGTSSPSDKLHIQETNDTVWNGVASDVGNGSFARVLNLSTVAGSAAGLLVANRGSSAATGGIVWNLVGANDHDVYYMVEAGDHIFTSETNATVYGRIGPAGWTIGENAADTLTNNCETVSQPNIPCFLVRNSSTDTNQTGAGTSVTIDCDSETFDQSGDFAADTFTAPATGKYLLILRCMAQDLTTVMNLFGLELVTSNRTFGSTTVNINVETNGDSHVELIAVIADMDAADTAFGRLTIAGGAGDTADITGTAASGVTYISGVRVA